MHPVSEISNEMICLTVFRIIVLVVRISCVISVGSRVLQYVPHIMQNENLENFDLYIQAITGEK